MRWLGEVKLPVHPVWARNQIWFSGSSVPTIPPSHQHKVRAGSELQRPWAVSRAEQMIRGASESVTVRLSLGCTRTGPGVDR